MKHEQCPPQDDLSAFVRSQVSDEQAEAISDHLANCPQCEETVVGLEKSADTVFDRLKGFPASFPFQDEPELARMVQAVKQRSPQAEPEKSDSPPPVAMLEQLRDYRILEKIGEGGMGTVYRAIHTRLNKIVAIKVLSSSRLKDDSAISRFQREISIVGQLLHPNIVQAHDAGEENGQHFLVMEYVEGTDLSEIVRRSGPLPVKAACEIIAQAATGLQYAFENGLVHRDIKPSNLMLSVSTDKRTNEVIATVVKILDLGLARLHTEDKDNGPELTTEGQIMGTLDYMAPEQGGDSRSVDIRSDIYSLGATLYKLLTGESLFGGERNRSVMQKLTALTTEPAPSVRGRRPEAPEALAAIIARMVSKQPHDRFATPAEVASALEPFRSGAELPALLGLSSRPSDDVLPGPTVQLASINQPPKTRRPIAATAKWFFGAAALCAIILTITTKQGTIEVESPDGKLPDDVKVVVSRGGDVEVLQADNQWKASVAGGKFQLAIQGGNDRFELQESTLTVNRFGKNVVILRIKPAAIAAVVAPVDVKEPEIQQKPATASSSREKPFRVTRKNEPIGEFNSLYGAVSAMEKDDVIEVHSNGPVTLTMPEWINKPLHLRAGKGYRPMLVLKQNLAVSQGLVIEDCDVDHRTGGWALLGPACEFRRCRFWGGGLGYCFTPRIIIEDCIFDILGGFVLGRAEAMEIVIANCAIRSQNTFLEFEDGAAPIKARFTNNTFRPGKGILTTLTPGSKLRLTIEARGNCFDVGAAHPWRLIGGDAWSSRVDWQGNDNLYCGKWYVEQAADGKATGEEGLSAWNKLWEKPEQGSREIVAISFAGARTGQWSSGDRVAEIRSAVEQIKVKQGLKTLGPDWNLVGIGESYLRALAADGKAVPQERLRPEPLVDGAVVILRQNTEFKGFPTLKNALDVAESGDVIEIRTDDPIPGAVWEGTSRRLTLRAGPGYTPIINGPLFTDHDRLILEGLTFRNILANSGNFFPYPGKGRFERISNCICLSPENWQVGGWFRAEGEQVPEITNCVLGWVAAEVPVGKQLQIKNSILVAALVNVEDNTEPGQLEILDSVFWIPDPATVPDVFSITMGTPLKVNAKNSLFVSPGALIQIHDIVNHFRGWSGSQNVFMKTGGFVASIYDGTGSIGTLDELRKLQNTDADSLELPPLSFDAENWRIWREHSTGYQPRAEALDFGADIDRLLKALTADDAAAN